MTFGNIHGITASVFLPSVKVAEREGITSLREGKNVIEKDNVSDRMNFFQVKT